MLNFVEHPTQNEFSIVHKINDQFLLVIFQGERTNNIFYWNIAIVVYDKEEDIDTHFTTFPRTGRQGANTLVLAQKTIVEFEKFIIGQYCFNDMKHIIYAGWHDEVRHRVYERGLLRIGYVYDEVPVDNSQEFFFVKRLF